MKYKNRDEIRNIFDILNSTMFYYRNIIFDNYEDAITHVRIVNEMKNRILDMYDRGDIDSNTINRFIEDRVEPLIDLFNQIDPDILIDSSHDYRYIIDLLIEDAKSLENRPDNSISI